MNQDSELVSLLVQLVAINSVNPSLIENAAGEREIAEFIVSWCKQRNLEVYLLDSIPSRPSVVAIARGRGGGRSIMLNAHTDTVGVAGMTDPFHALIEGKYLYARGALDMKAGLAASMIALEQAAKLGLAGDVILTAVADEEHSSLGTQLVLEHFSADAAILTEPTELDVCVAHRGFAVFEIDVHGLASHTSQPELGANAVTHAGRILSAIEALDLSLQQGVAHPLLGHGSAQVTRIRGGSALFTMPELCQISFERRHLPEQTISMLETELNDLLANLADPRFVVSRRLVVAREALGVAEDETIVQILNSNLQRRKKAAFIGKPYWMDSGLLAAAGIPTVVFGPGGHGLHAVDEWVDLEQVQTCAAVLLETIQTFCA